MSNAEDFTATQAEIEAITDDQIKSPGLPIDIFLQESENLYQWCQDDKPARTLMTINAAHLMMMRNDSGLNQALNAGDLIVADGLPVVWGTQYIGTPLVGRVAGIDLMQNLLQVGDENNLRIFLLGAKQPVIDDLVDKCIEKYPNLVIAGSRNGYFDKSDDTDVVRQVQESSADILFIGMLMKY